MLDRAYLPRPLAVVVPCLACCVIVASSCRALLPRVVVASSCRVPCRHGVIVPPIAVVLPPIKPNLDSLSSIKKGRKIRRKERIKQNPKILP